MTEQSDLQPTTTPDMYLEICQLDAHIALQSVHDDGSVNGSLSQLLNKGIPPNATIPKIGITFFALLLKNSLRE